MRVLVVDNDGEIRELLQEVLEEEGYGVTTAPDGWAALGHLWMTCEARVVLVDQRMPGLTGREVVAAYREMGAPPGPAEFVLLSASPSRWTSCSRRWRRLRRAWRAGERRRGP